MYYLSNLKRNIDKYITELPPSLSPEVNQVNSTPSQAPKNVSKSITSPTRASTLPLDRHERFFMRNRISARSLKGIEAVNLQIVGDEDVIIDPMKLPTFRKSYTQVFQDDVIKKSSSFNKPFGSLTMKEKKLRSNGL